jgi:hypothetical protein
MTSPTSTFSAESAASPSPLSQPDFAPSDSAKSNLTRAACSPSVGLAFQTSETCESEPTLPGFEVSPSSLEDSPASRGPKPDSAEAKTILVTSGRQCARLSRLPGPLGSLVKMCLESSTWGSTTCSLTWRTRVTPRNRLMFRLWPSMPATSASASGLWPTPTVGGGGQTLPEGTTPTGKTPEGRKQTVCLERFVMNVERGIWPTPLARDCRTMKGSARMASAQGAEPLSTVVQKMEGIENGRLNPQFVEWLMGYPHDHTLLKPSSPVSKGSATRSSRKSRKDSSASSPRSSAVCQCRTLHPDYCRVHAS